MKAIEIKVRDVKSQGVYEVVVNGQVLRTRHHARFANERALAFANYLKSQGMIVHLTLSPKAV